MKRKVSLADLAQLVENAAAVGRIRQVAWASDLLKFHDDDFVIMIKTPREQLARVYARRSRRDPNNEPLASAARELAEHSGSMVLLGYVNLGDFVGHLFLDEDGANLLGAVIKAHTTGRSSSLA